MTRAAVHTICPRCWTYTRTGADADACALTAVVDDVPLSRTGELMAVVAGRLVYECDLRGALHYRDRWSIRSAAKGVVYAAHRCDEPIPAPWRQPTSPPAPAPTTEESF